MPELRQDSEGNLIEVETAEEANAEVFKPYSEPIQVNGGDDMSDLFTTPQSEDADFATSDLFEVDDELEEDDMSDLFDVTSEDVMGPKPKRKLKRTIRPYRQAIIPPGMMGRVGY